MDQRAGNRRWYEVVGQALLEAAQQYQAVRQDQRHGATGGTATS